MLKKYVVLKVWNSFRPDVVETFDEWNDAVQFAKLCNKASGYNHVVAEVKE